ncbi:MAG: hypothetical protein R3264_08320 [Anaerolineae bacterium]|nr:hypothetical protein [Anaerolineae bacterium]
MSLTANGLINGITSYSWATYNINYRIVADKWRRVTFILTTGDRFEAAEEINDLYLNQSPSGQFFVTLKEEDVSGW